MFGYREAVDPYASGMKWADVRRLMEQRISLNPDGICEMSSN
jgi:hypothetical protein